MKFKVILLVLSAALSQAVWSAPPQASGQPLDQHQLEGLVNGGVDSHRLALLVASRGIDFEPTQKFFEALQKAGAQDVLIQAIKDARRRNLPATAVAAQTLSSTPRGKTAGAPIAAAHADKLEPVEANPTMRQPAPAGDSAPAAQPEPPNSAAVMPATAVPAQPQPVLAQELARAADLEERQSWPEAEETYRAASKLEPANASTHLGLARALGGQKKWDEAIAEYREAVRLNPEDAQAHRALGLALAEKQDWNGAIPEYREALSRHSSDPELEQKLGEALYAKGDLTGSVSALRAAASLEPGDARVRNRLGLGLYGLGDLDGAIAAYREAVSLDPKYAEAYNNLGDALLKKGDRRGALEAYHHAFELAPNNSTLGASYEAIFKQLNP
jgi:tetratricopeptide (TPR) repeat protein